MIFYVMKILVALLSVKAELLSAQSLVVEDMQICLTWNTTANNLYLKCNVLSHEYQLVLMDPFSFIRAVCFKNRTPSCVTRREEDMIFDNISHNGFSLVLKTDRQNGEGDWKCSHGSNVANVNISLAKGTVYSAAIYFYGKIMETNDKDEFKLTCSSCWIPHTKSVYLFVNGVLEDTIRYSDGKCYHKRELCSSKKCECSMEGNHFTWIYKSNMSHLKLSCEMRFIDEETSTLSIQTAHLVYNADGFNMEVKETKTVTSSDMDIYTSSDTPKENKIDSADAQTNRGVVYIIVCTALVTITTGIAILFFVYPDIPGRIKQMKARHFSVQKDYERLKESDGCDMCKDFSKCGICFDCKKFYCEICCKYHLKKHTEHRVSQIHFYLARLTDIKCNMCYKLAERICMDTWNTFCAPCAKIHGNGKEEMTIIYQSPSGVKRQKTGGHTKNLNHVTNMPILGDSDPVRICGLCYLADGTVVAVDGNNYKLIVFMSNDQQLKEQLEDEPSAMTAMTGNEIAVTFPYQKQIRIYKINLKKQKFIDSKDEPNIIDIVSLGYRTRKPFSIAYNKGYFAVEVGEGENGMFLIIDIAQKKVMKEIKSEFAYFTGHTIRLGLKVIEFKNNETIDGRLFVSAMSKKMVSCLNFDGQKQWHISDPSPRSIIVPEDESLGENIILSSRRSNTIYQLNQQNGNYTSLKVKDNLNINSPRYIAYHSNTHRLCALVVNDKTHKDVNTTENDKTPEDDKTTEDDKTPEDELVFYEFRDHEQNESSPLVDDNVEEPRI